MTAMKRAHELRRQLSPLMPSKSYREMMSMCLKQAHNELKIKAKAAQLKAAREANRPVFKAPKASGKEFAEMDIAKAAFAADQRDRALGLNVRGY